jgi:glycosyltransferase involved in cell wall biosynthesis
MGVGVRVCGVEDGSTAEDLSAWLPLKPHVFPRRGPKFFGYAPGLDAMLRAERPSVIGIHGLWKYTSVAVVRYSAAMGCPYVVHPHGMLDRWAVRHSGWKKRLAGWAYEHRHLKRAACLRALNHSEAGAIREFGLRNPICVIPNAVDLPTNPGESIPSDCGHNNRTKSDSLGTPFPENRRVVLFLGRIHPKKGLPALLEAWAKIRTMNVCDRQSDEWILAIAGWDQGGHEAELRRQVADLGLQNSVVFLGPQFGERKAACFRHCDAFVLPSFSEGLPMVILEAWASAKPVLMTPECNLLDEFSAGAAIRIEPSRESIVVGLRTLLEMTSSERRRMGEQGLAIVRDRYTWPEVAGQLLGVYKWLAGCGPTPACVEFN